MSLIYFWCVRNMDEKQHHKFESRLWIPPPGRQARGPWDPDNETALFRRAKAMTGDPKAN